MSRVNTQNRFLLAAALAMLLAIGAPGVVYAQTGTTTTPAQDIGSKRVSLNLENADIRYALRLLFNSVGANFSIDPSVQGTVTVSLTDVPFSTALATILRGSTMMPLTYRMENGVYSISPRVEQPVEATTPEETTPTTTATGLKYRPVKIPIMYADPNAIAYVLGGTSIPNMYSQMIGGGGGYGGGGYGGGYGGGMGGYGGGYGGYGGGMGGYGGGFGTGLGQGYGGFGGGGFGNSFGGGFGNSFGGGFGNSFGGGLGGFGGGLGGFGGGGFGGFGGGFRGY